MAEEVNQQEAPSLPQPAAASQPAAPALSPAEEEHKKLIDEYEFDVPEVGTTNPPAKGASDAQPAAASESAAPAASKPKHSKRALQMAQDFGIPQAEIDAATPEELDSAVYHLNKQYLAHLSDLRRNQPNQPAPQAPAAPPEDAIEWGEHKDDVTGEVRKYADADIHPSIVKVLKEQARQIRELKQHLGQINQRDEQREVESSAGAIDKFFNDLASPLFGQGSWQEMADTAEYDRRKAVVLKATELAGPNATRRQQLAKLKAAQERLYPEVKPARETEQPKAAPEKARDDLGRYTPQQRRWIEAGVLKPTHRANGDEPKGLQRATNALREKMEAAGMDPAGGNLESELESELPD